MAHEVTERFAVWDQEAGDIYDVTDTEATAVRLASCLHAETGNTFAVERATFGADKAFPDDGDIILVFGAIL